mgnify:CR=1 FL=1|tara:strand:+ start:867 stop:1952 length:1086 start_codon:yes stop_codon:yes gene_type:complete
MNFDFEKFKKIIVTGGAGFIGKHLIKKLLEETTSTIFNIDKLGYASDHKLIDLFLENNPKEKRRYFFLENDLSNHGQIHNSIKHIDPDLVIHLAAESHVDRSIDNPYSFIQSNILGTFNLLDASFKNWQSLKGNRKKFFRFVHVSTDEVFGSVEDGGFFNEESNYDPRSPYSASKASSDHLVKSWFHTYNFPIIISNCSNNFGPWQYPEKLIPTVIMKCLSEENIPIYGNGLNIRDWIYVNDHINALLLLISGGRIGERYCIGANQEKTNLCIAEEICLILDNLKPRRNSYKNLISFVKDRPGHDKRYSINSSKISKELGWKPHNLFSESLFKTVNWYIENKEWCKDVSKKTNLYLKRQGI